MAPTFSLCVIYRDEARLLPEFIARHGRLFDDYVFVDTGSRDDGPAILQAAGFASLQIEWPGDFSAARNISLQHATGSHIVVLDIDEWLPAEDFARLQGLVARHDADAYWLDQVNFSDDFQQVGWRSNRSLPQPMRGFAAGYITSSLVRVFRNGCGITFRGAIHEMAADSIKEKGLRSVVTPVPIYHLGWTAGGASAKKERYREMIRAAWESEKSPKSALYYIMTLPDDDPEKIRIALQMTHLCPHVAEFWEILVFACSRNGQWLRVRGYCRKGLERHPGSLPLRVALTGALRELGSAEEALELSTVLHGTDPQHPLYALEHLKNLVVLKRHAAAAALFAELPAGFPPTIREIMRKLVALTNS
jgi:hypothetical protein